MRKENFHPSFILIQFLSRNDWHVNIANTSGHWKEKISILIFILQQTVSRNQFAERSRRAVYNVMSDLPDVSHEARMLIDR